MERLCIRQLAMRIRRPNNSGFPHPPLKEYYDSPLVPQDLPPTPTPPSSKYSNCVKYINKVHITSSDANTLLLLDIDNNLLAGSASKQLKQLAAGGIYMTGYLVSIDALNRAIPKLVSSTVPLEKSETRVDYLEIMGACDTSTRQMITKRCFPIRLLSEFDIYDRTSDLFSIISYKFSGVKTFTNVDQLTNFVKFCDKYECKELIAPWIDNWVAGAKPSCACGEHGSEYGSEYSSESYGSQIGCKHMKSEPWAVLGVILDRLEESAAALRALALETSALSSCGEYVLRDVCYGQFDEPEVRLDRLPGKIIEYMIETRLTAIEQIVTVLRAYLSSLAKVPRRIESGCQGKTECRVVAFGSLAETIHEAGLWPLLCDTTPKVWTASVATLLEQIKKVHVTTLHGTVDSHTSSTEPQQALVTLRMQVNPDDEPSGVGNGRRSVASVFSSGSTLLAGTDADLDVCHFLVRFENVMADVMRIVDRVDGKIHEVEIEELDPCRGG